jgi:hypothetical protein
LRGDSSDPTGDLIFCDTLADAVTGSDYIQENGPEKLDLKQSLIAEIDRHAAPHVIIGSSTSSLKATDLQVRCRHPERVLVAHPFNPSHLLPLVELVRGAKTSEAVQNAAAEFFARYRFAYRKKLLVTSQTGWLPLCGARLFILSQKVSPRSKMSTVQSGSDLDCDGQLMGHTCFTTWAVVMAG